jgi:hypothetical protein
LGANNLWEEGCQSELFGTHGWKIDEKYLSSDLVISLPAIIPRATAINASSGSDAREDDLATTTVK